MLNGTVASFHTNTILVLLLLLTLDQLFNTAFYKVLKLFVNE